MDKLILIDKKKSMTENIGVAYISLGIDPGKYKLYYMRIENE